MKNVYCISTKQHGGIKSGVLQSKNSTISQAVRASALLLEGVKVKLSAQVCESDCFGYFCGYNVNTSTVCHQ